MLLELEEKAFNLHVHIDDISYHLVSAFNHASADSGSGRTTGFPSRTEKLILKFAEQCLAPAHILNAEEKGVIVCGMQGEGFRWQPQRFADSETANLSLHLSLLLLSLLPAIRPLP